MKHILTYAKTNDLDNNKKLLTAKSSVCLQNTYLVDIFRVLKCDN